MTWTLTPPGTDFPDPDGVRQPGARVAALTYRTEAGDKYTALLLAAELDEPSARKALIGEAIKGGAAKGWPIVMLYDVDAPSENDGPWVELRDYDPATYGTAPAEPEPEDVPEPELIGEVREVDE